MKSLKTFLLSHAGKCTAGVCLADLLIAGPPALSWIVAGYLLYWAVGHLRQAFRLLDAPPVPPVTDRNAVAVEATRGVPDRVDPLDLATGLDMAAGAGACPPPRPRSRFRPDVVFRYVRIGKNPHAEGARN